MPSVAKMTQTKLICANLYWIYFFTFVRMFNKNLFFKHFIFSQFFDASPFKGLKSA